MRRPAVEIVTFTGELDIARKEELRAALTRAQSASAALLDLAEVTYADSTALTELLRFRMQAQEHAIPGAMVVATPQLDRIIQCAGLGEAFDIFESRDDALRHVEGQS